MSDRIYSVSASALRLRSAPSTDAAVLAKLLRGQLVARLDFVERGAWWRIFADTPGDGAYVGYVDRTWLKLWSAEPAPDGPAHGPAPAPATPSPPGSQDFALALSPEGFEAEAARLGVGHPEFWAVLEVEARGEGFFVGGSKHRLPQILFERHIFSRETSHRFDRSNPDISAPTGYTFEQNAAPEDRYGSLDGQYPRLAAAATLDRTAALRSASWGIGQIMGFNHRPAGYGDVEAMVADMRRSEDLQFRAFASFLINMELAGKLQQRDWAKFAEGYNGTSYRRFSYDTKLAARYEELKTRSPDILLRQAQVYLKQLDHYRGKADGLWGGGSRAAVAAYLRVKGETAAPEELQQKPSPDFLRSLIAEAARDAAAHAPVWPLEG